MNSSSQLIHEVNICAGHVVQVLEDIFPLRLQLIATWLEDGADEDLAVTSGESASRVLRHAVLHKTVLKRTYTCRYTYGHQWGLYACLLHPQTGGSTRARGRTYADPGSRACTKRASTYSSYCMYYSRCNRTSGAGP